MMASLFVLFVIELWLHSKTGGHSHGGATGEELTNNAPSSLPSVPVRPEHRYHSSQDSLSSELTAAEKDAVTEQYGL